MGNSIHFKFNHTDRKEMMTYEGRINDVINDVRRSKGIKVFFHCVLPTAERKQERRFK
jgi:hypothetical protein